MLEKTRGILLNHINYSDSSSIAHIYTENFGRISLLVRHAKNKKAITKKSILQPLFLLELQIHLKQNREIQNTTEIVNSPVFHTIPFNIVKSSIVIFLAEVLSKVLREEEANPAMFSFLFNSIQLLDHLEKGTANFHLVFLYELSRYLGFYPSDNFSDTNRFFNLREGNYSPLTDIPGISLDDNLSKKLRNIGLNGFNTIQEIEIGRNTRNKLLEVFLRFYHYHLPGMGQIKSLDILNEIFKPD